MQCCAFTIALTGSVAVGIPILKLYNAIFHVKEHHTLLRLLLASLRLGRGSRDRLSEIISDGGDDRTDEFEKDKQVHFNAWRLDSPPIFAAFIRGRRRR